MKTEIRVLLGIKLQNKTKISGRDRIIMYKGWEKNNKPSRK